MKVFLARDGEKDGKNNEDVWQFDDMPTKDRNIWESATALIYRLNAKSYPHIKNGECYEYELKEIGKVEDSK